MSVETFSKGLVEIIASSDDSERVENEILQVFKSLSDSSEALDVFRNFGIPVEKKIEAVQNLLSTRVLPLTVDLVTLTISKVMQTTCMILNQMLQTLLQIKEELQ